MSPFPDVEFSDDLYREIILDHFKNPRNKGKLEGPGVTTVQGTNPLCGDEIELSFILEGDRIRDIKIQGKGCSISQASASMMTEVLKGHSISEAQQITQTFREAMLEGENHSIPKDLGDLESLEGVKKYPVRIKCAILCWNTFLEGLKGMASTGPSAVSSGPKGSS